MEPDSIRVRPATPEEVEFLCALRREAMRPHVERAYGKWDDEAESAKFHARIDPASHEIIEVAGEPVGCRWVRRHPDSLELVRLYLLPGAQGCGIGTRIVEQILAEAARAELPVRLRVLKGNPARRLYVRLGFVEVRESETHHYMEANAPTLR